MNSMHFLLTRFNIPFGIGGVHLGLTADWLSHRFELFEHFCLPSVHAQTVTDFYWIIAVDPATATIWRLRLERALTILTARVLVIETTELSEQVWIDAMRSIIGNEKDLRILTTRLDNDDLIASDYLETVRAVCDEIVEGSRTSVVSFRSGLQFAASGIYEIEDRSNPFLSVSTPIASVKTAYYANHRKMSEIGDFYDVSDVSDGDIPMWGQVIHGRNLRNHVRGRKREGDLHISRFCICADWQTRLGGV
jgi:hypothetical protein